MLTDLADVKRMLKTWYLSRQAITWSGGGQLHINGSSASGLSTTKKVLVKFGQQRKEGRSTIYLIPRYKKISKSPYEATGIMNECPSAKDNKSEKNMRNVEESKLNLLMRRYL